MAEPVRLGACPLCGQRFVQPDGMVRGHMTPGSGMRCPTSRHNVTEFEERE